VERFFVERDSSWREILRGERFFVERDSSWTDFSEERMSSWRVLPAHACYARRATRLIGRASTKAAHLTRWRTSAPQTPWSGLSLARSARRRPPLSCGWASFRPTQVRQHHHDHTMAVAAATMRTTATMRTAVMTTTSATDIQ
jgi:hypothetical protein